MVTPTHLIDLTQDQRYRVFQAIENMKYTYKSMFCAFSAFEVSRKDISIAFTAEYKHVRSQRTKGSSKSHSIGFSQNPKIWKQGTIERVIELKKKNTDFSF